jgi:hypothetical protein
MSVGSGSSDLCDLRQWVQVSATDDVGRDWNRYLGAGPPSKVQDYLCPTAPSQTSLAVNCR